MGSERERSACAIGLVGLMLIAPPLELSAQAPEGRRHPISSLVRDPAPVTVTLAPGASPPASVLGSIEALSDGVEMFRVGSLDGAADALFGEIADVGVGLDGSMVVLDAMASTVRVYSPDGDLVESVGQPGEGPGEFAAPVAAALESGSGRLVVVDMRRIVSEFEPTEEGYQYVRQWRVDAAPGDICVLGDLTFVSVLPADDTPSLVAFDRDGEVEWSAASTYAAGSASVTRAANEGVLACVGGAEPKVLFGSLLLGRVFAFRASDGRALWSAQIGEYTPTEVWEVDGGMIVRTTAEGTHRIRGVAPFPNGRGALVQVSLHTGESHEQQLPYVSLDALGIEADGGTGGGVPAPLGEVAAIGVDRWVEVQRVPFPRLIVRSRR